MSKMASLSLGPDQWPRPLSCHPPASWLRCPSFQLSWCLHRLVLPLTRPPRQPGKPGKEAAEMAGSGHPSPKHLKRYSEHLVSKGIFASVVSCAALAGVAPPVL